MRERKETENRKECLLFSGLYECRIFGVAAPPHTLGSEGENRQQDKEHAHGMLKKQLLLEYGSGYLCGRMSRWCSAFITPAHPATLHE